MRSFWIRFKAFVRLRLLAPFKALSAPAKAFVKTSDGRVRWWQFGGLLAVVGLVIAGSVIGFLGGGDVVEVEEISDQGPGVGVQQELPRALFRGEDVLLNPSPELDKHGRVPFVKTTDPGVLAEAFTRFSQTVDMGRDSARERIAAEEQWLAGFVPRGFEGVVRSVSERKVGEAELLQDWSRYSAIEPVISGFTTGVYINHEIVDAPLPDGFRTRPMWTSQIPVDTNVHVVRTEWIASMAATKDVGSFEPQSGSGVTEVLIVCPGARGFTEDVCKVVDAADSPGKFFSFRLSAWPEK